MAEVHLLYTQATGFVVHLLWKIPSWHHLDWHWTKHLSVDMWNEPSGAQMWARHSVGDAPWCPGDGSAHYPPCTLTCLRAQPPAPTGTSGPKGPSGGVASEVPQLHASPEGDRMGRPLCISPGGSSSCLSLDPPLLMQAAVSWAALSYRKKENGTLLPPLLGPKPKRVPHLDSWPRKRSRD